MSHRGRIIRRAGQEHRQELTGLVKQASTTTSTWRVWDDLMFMASAAISQPLRWNQKREDEYLNRIRQYEPKLQSLFPMMFAEIVLTLEQEGITDVLGDMFMELELYNHWRGQYFTPKPISQMMGQLVGSDASELIEQRGFITVNDPCCGSGAMLIAFARDCMDEGIKFQHDVLFIGQDVDPVVARMWYVQMSLLGMSGYVIIGNNLLYPPTGRMHPKCEYLFTPMYYVHGFQWRRQKQSSVPVDRICGTAPA